MNQESWDLTEMGKTNARKYMPTAWVNGLYSQSSMKIMPGNTNKGTKVCFKDDDAHLHLQTDCQSTDSV